MADAEMSEDSTIAKVERKEELTPKKIRYKRRGFSKSKKSLIMHKKITPDLKQINNLQIDHIEFLNVDLKSAAKQLNAKIKELKLSNKIKKIIFIQKTEKANDKKNRITMTFDNVSLGKVINDICNAVDATFYIEEKQIIIRK
jgi:hypothetical protein